jgi:putative endonuclease
MPTLYWVYILASRTRGALYVGVTNDINARLHLHRSGGGSVQVRRYAIYRLVYAESFADVREAIAREKQIKKWRRQWKIELIESANPGWKDLSLHPVG